MHIKIELLLLFLLLYTLIIAIPFLLYMKSLRRRITAFSEKICTTIEDMADGSENPRIYKDEETLLSKINHHLGNLYGNMMESRQKVAEEKANLQELISDISHQVKTPVANLKMVTTTLIERDMPAAKQKEFLKASEGQLDKLDFLMQSMIKTSRMETGMIRLRMEKQSISGTLAANLYDIVLLAEAKNITLDINVDEKLEVRHDRKWTAEALFNLLENAVKYTPSDGHISVQTEIQELYTKISVADTGKGIPEKHYPKIFQRFYREPDVHDAEGIGIGLYLAREIFTLQGGYLMVSSQVGIGSVFTAALPNK